MLTAESVATGLRRERWIEQIRESYVKLDVFASFGSAFHGAMISGDLPGLKLTSVRSGAQRLMRTFQTAALDADDCLIVAIQTAGHAVLMQDGRTARLLPGDFAICDSVRPFVLDFDSDFEQLVLSMRGDRIRAVIGHTDNLTATTMSSDRGAGHLLLCALTWLRTQLADLTTSAAAVVDSVLHLLLANLHSLPTFGQNQLSSMGNYHLARIKQRIDERLSDPALTIESVAAALGMSEGHLHRIFKAEPLSPSQYMWARRLEACSRELLDPQRARISVAEIAFRWGFRNAAHFSRAFRERFGHSPREWRRLAAADTSPDGSRVASAGRARLRESSRHSVSLVTVR